MITDFLHCSIYVSLLENKSDCSNVRTSLVLRGEGHLDKDIKRKLITLAQGELLACLRSSIKLSDCCSPVGEGAENHLLCLNGAGISDIYKPEDRGRGKAR